MQGHCSAAGGGQEQVLRRPRVHLAVVCQQLQHTATSHQYCSERVCEGGLPRPKHSVREYIYVVFPVNSAPPAGI